MTKPILLVASVVLMVLWVLAITRWRRRTLEWLPAGTMAWFWLRAFGIPETDTNRERLLIGASVLGMALVTIGTLGVFVFGQL